MNLNMSICMHDYFYLVVNFGKINFEIGFHLVDN